MFFVWKILAVFFGIQLEYLQFVWTLLIGRISGTMVRGMSRGGEGFTILLLFYGAFLAGLLCFGLFCCFFAFLPGFDKWRTGFGSWPSSVSDSVSTLNCIVVVIRFVDVVARFSAFLAKYNFNGLSKSTAQREHIFCCLLLFFSAFDLRVFFLVPTASGPKKAQVGAAQPPKRGGGQIYIYIYLAVNGLRLWEICLGKLIV